MNTAQTITALRDALTKIAEYPRDRNYELTANGLRHIARDVLALTADASEDAPDETEKQLRNALSKATEAMCRIHDALGLDPAMPIDDRDMIAAIQRMRSAFHVNMLRAFPGKSHDEIAAEIDNACGHAARPAPVAATKAPDAVVEANRELLRQRSEVGVRKYGVTLADSNLTERELTTHALEEALDLANYLQAILMRTAAPAAPIAEEAASDSAFNKWFGTWPESATPEFMAIAYWAQLAWTAGTKWSQQAGAVDGEAADSAADAKDAERIMEMELALYRDAYGTKAPSEALVDVIDERQRQISAKDWSHEHDDAHPNGEIAAFAAVYAMPPATRDWLCVAHMGYGDTLGEALCPEDWTPKFGERRRELVKAGALILAEIERIDRAGEKT